jgi:hypothetical protein
MRKIPEAEDAHELAIMKGNTRFTVGFTKALTTLLGHSPFHGIRKPRHFVLL